ncbi:DEXQc_UvrD domain containing protein [Comamonadaceae bacterium]
MNSRFVLTEDDLALLARLFPALKFDREEQIHALLHSSNGDFQAGPGSGKTTLLGAKLALMAARWPYERRGICILTHTNVAREEIERCLRSVPHGERLLSYPHFIGTIQSFVNRFLALPWLRSQGIELREIDNDDFEELFSRRVRQDWSVNRWIASNEFDRASMLRGVRYVGSSLSLSTSARTSLPMKGQFINQVKMVKDQMMNEGRVRHEDMFAFAEQALEQVPSLQTSLEHRFPNVFIDEMQDTNDAQLEVLTTVFKTASVVQRFGDINQSILCRGDRTSPHAFPAEGHFEVNTSLRFGTAIADVVNSVKAVGSALIGEGDAFSAGPALILYSDATVSEVIARFGSWLASLMSQEELGRYPVKAVCAIKRVGNSKQRVGRHISDYFSGYDDGVSRPTSSKKSVRELLRIAADQAVARTERRTNASRDAVLSVLKEFGVESVKLAKTWRDLTKLLQTDVNSLACARHVVLRCVMGEYDVSTEANSIDSIHNILRDLDSLVLNGAEKAEIPKEWLADSIGASQVAGVSTNCLRVVSGNIEVPIHLATIASVKGETHLATLVLESCHNRKYDLQSVLPYLCGDLNAASTLEEDTMSQLMNVFVATSRPRKVLALAMHAERASKENQQKLKERGWQIIDWTV